MSEWRHSDFTTSFPKNIKPPLLIFASILLHVRFKGKVIPKIGLVLGFHLTHLYFRNALTSSFNLHNNAHACKHRVFQNVPKVHPLCKGTSKTSNFIYCRDCCGEHLASLTSNIKECQLLESKQTFFSIFLFLQWLFKQSMKKGLEYCEMDQMNTFQTYTMLQEHLLSTELCWWHIPSSTVALTLK